jgi:hypothetical protein
LWWWVVSSDVAENSGRVCGVEHAPSSPQEYPVVAWGLGRRRLHEDKSNWLCRRQGLRWFEPFSEAVRLVDFDRALEYPAEAHQLRLAPILVSGLQIGDVLRVPHAGGAEPHRLIGGQELRVKLGHCVHEGPDCPRVGGACPGDAPVVKCFQNGVPLAAAIRLDVGECGLVVVRERMCHCPQSVIRGRTAPCLLCARCDCRRLGDAVLIRCCNGRCCGWARGPAYLTARDVGRSCPDDGLADEGTGLFSEGGATSSCGAVRWWALPAPGWFGRPGRWLVCVRAVTTVRDVGPPGLGGLVDD